MNNLKTQISSNLIHFEYSSFIQRKFLISFQHNPHITSQTPYESESISTTQFLKSKTLKLFKKHIKHSPNLTSHESTQQVQS